MVKSWYSVKEPTAADGIAEVAIYNEIGLFGITAMEFRRDVLVAAAKASSIRVRINSRGGSLFDAIAMYNTLKSLNKRIIVVIDGLAASAASLIAMAGDSVEMPANAFMMVHLPRWSSEGTAEQLRKAADTLDSFRDSILNIYASKTGLSNEKLLKLLENESWLTASEAVKLGFADEITAAVKIAARADLDIFLHAPESLTSGNAAQQESINMDKEVLPGAATAKTEAEIRAEIQAEIKAIHEEITALCQIAKKPDLAAKFIGAGATVAAVRAELLKPDTVEEVTTANNGAVVSVADKAKANAEAAALLDPRAVYAEWNKVKVRR